MAKTKVPVGNPAPAPADATPVPDDRNLVLCDANGVERARVAGFHAFRVPHDGVIYEHCATDEGGRWIYRPM